MSLQGCASQDKETAPTDTSTSDDAMPPTAQSIPDMILEREAAQRAARPRVVVYDGNDSDSRQLPPSRGGWGSPVDSDLSDAGFDLEPLR
jgi:hypothetical protein